MFHFHTSALFYFSQKHRKYMSPSITALVPIKRHSERLAEKNFRNFNGRPLYHWIVDTLTSVSEINEIIINTDSERVMKEAPELFDVEISERPKHLRGDKSTTNIIKYEVEQNASDIYIHTYATNPLLSAETISTAIDKFITDETVDSLLPVTPLRRRFYNSNFEPINHDPHELVPTQHMEPIYEDNDALYMYTEKAIERTGHRIGENPMIFEIDKIEATDIDDKSDFRLAECLHKIKNTYE
jgi:N-acylneuraminate cytidylyltransferase